MVFMAQQKTNDPVASHNIAAAQGIPERFLLKVLKPLVSARVLVSIKGPNGGYRLARAANDINMLEILEAVDGPIRGNAPETKKSNPSLNNKLEAICNKSAEAVRQNLEQVRISDLAGGKREKEPAAAEPATTAATTTPEKPARTRRARAQAEV